MTKPQARELSCEVESLCLQLTATISTNEVERSGRCVFAVGTGLERSHTSTEPSCNGSRRGEGNVHATLVALELSHF